MSEHLNEIEFFIKDLGLIWIYKDKEENIYIQLNGGYTAKIPRKLIQPLKEYLKKEEAK